MKIKTPISNYCISFFFFFFFNILLVHASHLNKEDICRSHFQSIVCIVFFKTVRFPQIDGLYLEVEGQLDLGIQYYAKKKKTYHTFHLKSKQS